MNTTDKADSRYDKDTGRKLSMGERYADVISQPVTDSRTAASVLDRMIQGAKGSRKRMLMSLRAHQAAKDSGISSEAKELRDLAGKVAEIARRYPNSKFSMTLLNAAFTIEGASLYLPAK